MQRRARRTSVKQMGSATLALALMAGGCASQKQREVATTRPAPAAAATQPSNDPSHWTLERIEPRPVLVKAAPTTRPAKVPLEALELYAEGRAAQIAGDRTKAVRLLEQARRVDPQSFELNYSLGLAQLTNSGGNQAAIEAFERAAGIDPDHLGLQIHLGRLYFARGSHERAIHHLRLAMQTTEYREEPESAAIVDFWLGRALQQKGYDLAALERYQNLMDRLPHLRARTHPELYYLLQQPETLMGMIGALNEKLGRYEAALKAFEEAAAEQPNDFADHANIVRVLLRLRDHKRAKRIAAEQLLAQHASRESVELFRMVHEHAGQLNAVPGELRKLLKTRPGDRAIVFALADVLKSMDRGAEAEKLLAEAAKENDQDLLIVTRLFELYVDQGETSRAAELVIETLAQQPGALAELERLWGRLFRATSKNRLRLPMVQGLKVSDSARASKLYWLARTAELVGRDALARASLEEAAAIEPVFPPAHRELLEQIVERPDLSEEDRGEAAAAVIERVRKAGNAGLALELQGRAEMARGNVAAAADSLQRAIDTGVRGPEIHLVLAAALRSAEKKAPAEQTLWKIIRDWPTFEPAYAALFNHYLRDNPRRVVEVLQKWLAASPFSVQARVWQVRLMMQGENAAPAESAMLSLFRDEPDDPVVLAVMERFFEQGSRQDEYLKHLEEELSRRPANRAVAEALVREHLRRKQLLEAMRVLDTARRAVAGDVEQMYLLAHLYEQVGHRQVTESLLAEILVIDPLHAPANNDLGYMWTDDGRNLAQAESMIRRAVEVEPENAAYLDSLGWILYKRGKFDEARKYLKQATEGTDSPDPVVLDHLADALYRLNESAEAMKIWQQALDRLVEIPDGRDDLTKLRLNLRQKLRQQKAGEPVSVAPIATDANAAAGAASRAEK